MEAVAHTHNIGRKKVDRHVVLNLLVWLGWVGSASRPADQLTLSSTMHFMQIFNSLQFGCFFLIYIFLTKPKNEKKHTQWMQSAIRKLVLDDLADKCYFFVSSTYRYRYENG